MTTGRLCSAMNSWSVAPPAEAETIDWVKIEPEKGIDELVTWVFKRHLELYREREIV